MAEARLTMLAIDLEAAAESPEGPARFRATGKRID